MIEIRDLRKSFDGRTDILKDINITIKKGEIVAILGSSGTGKSTLLRCLNYLTKPTNGSIRIGTTSIDAKKHTKKDIMELRSHSAMVFQNYNLFKNKTAMENIIEALICINKKSKKDAQRIGLQLLEKVGMLDRKDFYPSKISGGQQQRIGIARALAVEPEVLLFDEPTSALDPELVGEVLSTIQKVAQEGATMVLVTHEIMFARKIATRILFMAEGTIVADGTPEEILDFPKDERLKRFLDYNVN